MPTPERKPDLHAPEPGADRALLRRVARTRRTGPAIKLATIGITGLFAYITLRGLDLSSAWRGLGKSDFWWLIPALVAFGLGNAARALRWRALFVPVRRPPFRTTLNAMMIGYLYNNILPARAGEAARVLVLTQRSSSPPVEIAGTVILERVYDVGALLLIFFAAEPWLPRVKWFEAAAIVAIVLAAAIAAIVVALAVYGDRPLRVLLGPLRRLSPITEERLEHVANQLVHGLSGLRRWRVALETFAWTVAAWMLSMVCALFVTFAFHLHLSFAAPVLVMVAIGLGMILPSAPAAVGVFEGATLIALRAFHVSASTALPYAVVLHLVNFVPFLVVGAWLLHHNSRRKPSTLYGATGWRRVQQAKP
jgi:uncharacterized protein (TIRG00374 family)